MLRLRKGLRQLLLDEAQRHHLAGDLGEAGEAALQAHCKAQLANYKIPQRVVVVEEFPIVNGPNGGKIQKRVLREWARELLGVSA